ncbi:MAG TPA: hypothetical protein V6C69_14210 [Trichormus sp.]|jgi:hypothetical protein
MNRRKTFFGLAGLMAFGLVTPAQARLEANSSGVATGKVQSASVSANAHAHPLTRLYTCDPDNDGGASASYLSNGLMSIRTHDDKKSEPEGYSDVQAGLFVEGISQTSQIQVNTVEFEFMPVNGSAFSCSQGPFVFAEGYGDDGLFEQLLWPSPHTLGPNGHGWYLGRAINTGGKNSLFKLGVLTTDDGQFLLTHIAINGIAISPDAHNRQTLNDCVFGNALPLDSNYCGNP